MDSRLDVIVGGQGDQSTLEPLMRPSLSRIWFSLTNRCNLRCVYCPQGSHEEGFHADTKDEQLEWIRTFLKNNGIREALVGFYGETIVVDNWEDQCKKFIEDGVRLTIITAFSKILSQREANVLSRFDKIVVSIDTVDIRVLREIRKSVDVRTIFYDMIMVRAAAIRLKIPPPKIHWNAVVSNRSVFALKELVSSAAACGVHLINLIDLSSLSGSSSAEPDATVAKSILDMPDEEFQRAAAELIEVPVFGESIGVQVSGRALLERVERKRTKLHRGSGASLTQRVARSAIQGTHISVDEAAAFELPRGYTRLCLDPWKEPLIEPKGEVYPCCASGRVMGRATSEDSFNRVLEGDEYRKLRTELLTGIGMDENCRACPIRDVAPANELQALVSKMLSRKSAPTPKSTKSPIPVASPSEPTEFEFAALELRDGWGKADRNIHGQSWRWLGQDPVLPIDLRLDRDYEVRTYVHTAGSVEDLNALELEAENASVEPLPAAKDGPYPVSRTRIRRRIGMSSRFLRFTLKNRAAEQTKMALFKVVIIPE